MLNKKVLMTLGWVIFLVLMVVAVFSLRKSTIAEGNVSIEFIKTKDDADCILIWQDGVSVMIDTGESEDVPHIFEELYRNNIESLDYLILTHNDKDHVGGAVDIVEKIDVKHVIVSGYAPPTQLTEKLDSVMKSKGVDVIKPVHNMNITLGDMRYVIYPPNKSYYEDDNNYSLAILLQHEGINCLFTGDAKKKRDVELLMIDWPKLNLYKVPYHGRACSKSDDLFDILQPEYSVVTSDKADDEIIESAKRNNSKLMYQSNGDIIFESDGRTLILK